jgi:hypothetical protein
MWSTRARHRVLEAAKSTPAVILRDLRPGLLATLTYFFGRITALKMRVDVHVNSPISDPELYPLPLGRSKRGFKRRSLSACRIAARLLLRG